MRNPDRILAVVVILVSVAYIFATANLPELRMRDPLGPRAFPYFVGILGLATSLFLLLETIWKKADSEELSANWSMADLISSGAIICWMLIFFASLEFINFFVSLSVFLLGLIAYFHRKKWVTNVVVSIAFSGGMFVIFTKFLGINF